MILYHFCCERDMRGIKNRGITKGLIYGEREVDSPGNGRKWQSYILPMWQWLTLDGDRSRQSWNTHRLLRYDRTEYRWTVEIPDNMLDLLYGRDSLENLHPGTHALFDGWPDSENWRVYHGEIPRRWLKKLERWNRAKQSWEICM